MSDTTKTADNVIHRRRAGDWNGSVLPGGHDDNEKGRQIVPTPGFGLVLAFPGCAVPVVNKPRRGRLPASVPSLSRERAAREQRAKEFQRRVEELQRREKHLAEIDAVLRVAENCMNMARAELEKVGKPGAAPWLSGRITNSAG